MLQATTEPAFGQAPMRLPEPAVVTPPVVVEERGSGVSPSLGGLVNVYAQEDAEVEDFLRGIESSKDRHGVRCGFNVCDDPSAKATSVRDLSPD